MHWPYFDMSSGQVFPMSEKYVEKRVTFGWRKEDIQGCLIFSYFDGDPVLSSESTGDSSVQESEHVFFGDTTMDDHIIKL